MKSEQAKGMNVSSDASFVPADNKLEAVARISSLTNSGPETLGPGSKERKSVLTNLANGLELSIDSSGTKQEVARRIANALGEKWTPRCESVGQTITLYGLNLLLECSTSFLAKRGTTPSGHEFDSVASEAEGISNVIVDSVPLNWDGISCVEEMQAANSNNWRQTEWQGWYLEYKAIPALVNRYGGGPLKVLNTKFDYALQHIWDLKAHSTYTTAGPTRLNQESQLNDQVAMRSAIEERGLGLIIVSGAPLYDGTKFTDWHRAKRGRPGGSRRTLKSAFRPLRLDAFFISDSSELQIAIERRQILEFNQGRQANKSPRQPKFKIHVNRCRGTDLQVYEYTFPLSET
jgi:hypothetical protein